MSFFSPRKKKHSSTSSSTSEHTSPQLTQFITYSQSHLQSTQAKRQSQPVCPWSALVPQVGHSPSPFVRHAHALSTSATTAGQLFLFGGYVHNSESPSNDLYVFSTRDYSTTLFQTSGDIPSPRFGHRAVLTSTTLLIWGGRTDFSDKNARDQINDDSLYLLDLVSRKWTCIAVNGPGPGGRHYHTMTLVGSKLVVFGGKSTKRCLNDIWALDLNCLKSNPFWESYEPAPGNEKPPPRAGHVSVTIGDLIIIFGGCAGPQIFSDTWSFDISTRKWTELQCTGSIPSPRATHAAVLIDDVMYVYGGRTAGRANLGDLFAFNLSTQQWTAFQDIGPSPCGRGAHAMACDGTRVFVIGGELSPGAQEDDAELIHVLETKHLDYPESESDAVNLNEKTTQLVRKLSASPTRGQPHRSSSSDAHAAHSVQKATPELDHPTSQQITCERNPSLNGLPSQPTGVDDKSRRIPQEDDDGESSAEHRSKLMAPDTSSTNDVTRLENERIAGLERQLSEMLAERDRHIAQLNGQLAQKSALLERAEAYAAEERIHAGLELRELQAKLNDLILSRDEHLRTIEQLQRALQESTSRAASAEERRQPACEHETELAEMRGELEEKKSELEAVRLRLTDAEESWAKSKAEADTLRAQTAAGLVNTDVDRAMHRLMERMQAMEEMASRRWNDKSIEEMECRNEG